MGIVHVFVSQFIRSHSAPPVFVMVSTPFPYTPSPAAASAAQNWYNTDIHTTLSQFMPQLPLPTEKHA